MRSLLTLTAALAICAGPALAQQPSQQDKTFAGEAASGNKAEIDTGRYMETHGQDVGVRQFGHLMITDHTAADTKLQKAATLAGVQLPAAPGPEAKKTMSQLQTLQGAELDRFYIHDMVQDHQQDVQLFQQEAQSGTSPSLKAYAQETLPTLQQHLAQAQALERTVGSGASGAQHR